MRSPTQYSSNPDISDTLNTPISSYVSLRSKRSREEITREDFTSFTREIKQMLNGWKTDQDSKLMKIDNTLSKIENKILDMEKSVEYMSQEYDTMREEIKCLKCTSQNQETKISKLEERVEDLQRIAHCNLVEIRNVPSQEKETKQDLIKIMLNLSQALSVKINSHDIRDAYRGPGKGMNKPIIMNLPDITTKYNILSALKLHNSKNPTNKIGTLHAGFTGPQIPIFISEHLTTNARRLFYLAREMKKANNIKFCWTSNGRVFIRKTDGSPAIQIRSEEQIGSFKQN